VFTSLLVGAQPRKGKTFTARRWPVRALDPYVRLSVFDGKGSPDWRKFALVAYTYGFGLLPDRVQGDPIENLRATLRRRSRRPERNVKLSELPTSVCPEGKLTRDIARDPRYGMPVWLIILDEFQEYLNTGDEEADLEIADLLLFLVKVGPSVGVILISSTQKPSGLGSTGKVAKRFTDYRDQHLTRFALKTGSYNVSDAVLGSGAYSEGYDSSPCPTATARRHVRLPRHRHPVRQPGRQRHGAHVPRRRRGRREDPPRGPPAPGARRHARRHGRRRRGRRAGPRPAHRRDRRVHPATRRSCPGRRSPAGWPSSSPSGTPRPPATPLSKTLRGLSLGIESKSGAEKGRAADRAAARRVPGQPAPRAGASQWPWTVTNVDESV
jgi:hypothetical protein